MNNPNPGVGRIASTFEGLHAKQRKALIPYVTAGWPFANITPALMHGMADAGASIIELGVPFSDPMADGPVIQKAGERALAAGVGLGQVLAHVQEFRQKNHSTPVVLMGYANPFERYDQLRGSGCFARDAAAAGVDGVLVVDSPPEECRDFAAALGAQGIDMIFLLAPTSTEARMRQVAQLASGYVYYVSLRGVTGSGALDVDDVSRMIARIRTHVRLPLGVGFGIRDAASARAISEVADAVIIGSRLIELLDGQPHEKVVPLAADFIRTLRRALDA